VSKIPITACVWDTSFFIPLAEYLAQHYEKVLYYCPRESGYMHSNDERIGEGIEGVEKINSVWDKLDNIDLFVFTDCVFSSEQEYLKSLGKLVWGCGKSEWLETDRFRTREWQKSVGLPTQSTEEIIGIDDLKESIKDNQFIKIDKFRADFETVKYYDRARNEQRFDEIKVKLGAHKNHIPFLVENKIDGNELGYDGWSVDSKYPLLGMCGVEIKDRAYFCGVIPYSKFPEPVKKVNEKLAEVFKKEKTRCTFSTEVRIDKKNRGYLIDVAMRNGNPPYQLYMELYSNYAECIYEGAKGNLIAPKIKYKYGALATIKSEFAVHNWLAIRIPKEDRQYVKIMNMTVIDNEVYHIPLYGLAEVGMVVGCGNTPKEAIDQCKERAGRIKGDSIEIDTDALDDALKVLKESGVEI